MAISRHLRRESMCLQHFTKDSVQALAWVKYASTLIVSLAGSAMQTQQAARPGSRLQNNASSPQQPLQKVKQKRLMLLVGCIDVIAYATFCTGFAYCGAAISTLLLAAGGQICTAILSRVVLKKHLTKQQVTSVSNCELHRVIR